MGVAEGLKGPRVFPALLALSVMAGCQDLILPPQVEESGEPGVPVYVASGAF